MHMDTVVLHVHVQFERLASKHASCRGTSGAIVILRSRVVRRKVNRRARAEAVFTLVGCWHRLRNVWESFPALTTRDHLAHHAAALLIAERKLAL